MVASTATRHAHRGSGMSQGEVRKRVWFYAGKKREAWGFTLVIGGKRLRRQGYASRAEAQDALDALKHPDPVAPVELPTITLSEALTRYLQAKARKRSLRGDERIAKHLKVEFGEHTPLAGITASRISEYKAK